MEIIKKVAGFVGNRRDRNYLQLVKELVGKSRAVGSNMSLDVDILGHCPRRL